MLREQKRRGAALQAYQQLQAPFPHHRRLAVHADTPLPPPPSAAFFPDCQLQSMKSRRQREQWSEQQQQQRHAYERSKSPSPRLRRIRIRVQRQTQLQVEKSRRMQKDTEKKDAPSTQGATLTAPTQSVATLSRLSCHSSSQAFGQSQCNRHTRKQREREKSRKGETKLPRG